MDLGDLATLPRRLSFKVSLFTCDTAALFENKEKKVKKKIIKNLFISRAGLAWPFNV